MPESHVPPLAERIARLAQFLAETDAVRVRIEREGEEIEVARRAVATVAIDLVAFDDGPVELPAAKLDAIAAELVGIFHLSRPAPIEGEILDDDRELAYIEALGIRNPVHSLGAGRIAQIAASDGAAVEYGQPLFLLDRG